MRRFTPSPLSHNMGAISIGTSEVHSIPTLSFGEKHSVLSCSGQLIALFAESIFFGVLSILYPMAIMALVVRLREERKWKATRVKLATATIMYVLAMVVRYLFPVPLHLHKINRDHRVLAPRSRCS